MPPLRRLAGLSLLPALLAAGAACAQSTAEAEAKARAANIAAFPDAARAHFGQKVAPAALKARAIGSYARGCLAGAKP